MDESDIAAEGPQALDEPRAAQAKRTRDPERTRANILAAATSEFSARGFAGARVDAIAARSGANKRMIYHYFGNKQGLWIAVLEEAYARVRTAELGLHLEEQVPEQAMRMLVRFTFDAFVPDRVFINLLNSENLHQARHLKQSSRIKSMHSPLIEVIRTILDRGVAAGVFRAGVDPAQLWMTIAGVSYFYFSNIYTLSVILDQDMKSKPGIEARRNHVVDFVMQALRPV